MGFAVDKTKFTMVTQWLWLALVINIFVPINARQHALIRREQTHQEQSGNHYNYNLNGIHGQHYGVYGKQKQYDADYVTHNRQKYYPAKMGEDDSLEDEDSDETEKYSKKKRNWLVFCCLCWREVLELNNI